uniref:Fgenesh protein 119 n=1 Tax=Beta vulgaris TaxID=161934 RepID=Q20CC4_BETVU|nr:Fgenesh protein 119 [Beta vulgaris]
MSKVPDLKPLVDAHFRSRDEDEALFIYDVVESLEHGSPWPRRLYESGGAEKVMGPCACRALGKVLEAEKNNTPVVWSDDDESFTSDSEFGTFNYIELSSDFEEVKVKDEGNEVRKGKEKVGLSEDREEVKVQGLKEIEKGKGKEICKGKGKESVDLWPEDLYDYSKRMQRKGFMVCFDATGKLCALPRSGAPPSASGSAGGASGDGSPHGGSGGGGSSTGGRKPYLRSDFAKDMASFAAATSSSRKRKGVLDAYMSPYNNCWVGFCWIMLMTSFCAGAAGNSFLL